MKAIYSIAEICARKGIKHFILSPGSRCAPLTAALVNHPSIITKIISDERSAAFIGLGMAQATDNPVGLLCTSGTAALNYSPAVAEAFYQQIPLIILTADRPPEWVDQQDGQTIRQYKIFGEHVKKFFQLPTDHNHKDSAWQIERTISEAINIAESFPRGPVHINIPLREPFYPESSDEVTFSEVRIIDRAKTESSITENTFKELTELFSQSEKILILAGQNSPDATLDKIISVFSDYHKIPVVTELNSNLHTQNSIHNIDIILSGENECESLKPDLLITFGKSILSKSLKTFLRKNKPKYHWHIDPSGEAADTFQCLTHIVPVLPSSFFRAFRSKVKNSTWLEKWLNSDKEALKFISGFFNSQNEFSEFEGVYHIVQNLRSGDTLHLSNSMPVRYANYMGSFLPAEVTVRANRGTSGIDGVVSTMVGNSFVAKGLIYLITGDLAFFYDRNAFWNNYISDNLRIVLLNNHGGGIFNMIKGPGNLKEAREYFITSQSLSANHLANEYNMEYIHCKDRNSVTNALPAFFTNSGKSKILEIETSIDNNTNVFNFFKHQIKEQYGK